MIDRLAIALSGLCLVHCLATAVLLGALSSLGGILGNPRIHETGLAVAIVLGGIALGRGIFEHRRRLPLLVGGSGLALMAGALSLSHGSGEILATIAGVTLLATGHYLNRAPSAT